MRIIKMDNKKGQAAMEFLTTYGWAFLIIIVAISGLTYFGVFNFQNKLPDACSFSGNTFTCGSYGLGVKSLGTYDKSSGLRIQLKNNLDKAVNITKIEWIEKSLVGKKPTCFVTGKATVFFFATAPTSTTINNRILPSETAYDFKLMAINNISTTPPSISTTTANGDQCGTLENVGQKKTFLVKIYYTFEGSAIETVSTGEITTTVQKAIV
jgi:hypothetical protein